MSHQATSNPLRKLYDAGEDAKEQDSSNTQNYGAFQFDPQQRSQTPPSEPFEPLDIASFTAGEHKIYEYLDASGLSEEDCSIYFKNARAQQQVLVQHFRDQGWSEEQLKAFNEACDSELPEQFSARPATNHQWRVKLVEELDRRKNWG